MEKVSKRSKAAAAKLSVKKIKASHQHRKIGHSIARFFFATRRKAKQTSKNLEGEKALCMHVIEILIESAYIYILSSSHALFISLL